MLCDEFVWYERVITTNRDFSDKAWWTFEFNRMNFDNKKIITTVFRVIYIFLSSLWRNLNWRKTLTEINIM